MSEIKAVLFDMDGVLIDSMPVIRKAFETAYREVVDERVQPQQISTLIEQYCQFLGYGFKQIMDQMGLPHAMQAPFVRVSRASLDEIVVFEGVSETIKMLHCQGVLLTVATGKDGYRAREILQKFGLEGYFALVTGSDEVARPKPAPDMLRYQLERLAIPPNQAVMVGDSPADIQAGKAAGVTTIGALWGYARREQLQGADYYFSEIAEFCRFFQPCHTHPVHSNLREKG